MRFCVFTRVVLERDYQAQSTNRREVFHSIPVPRK